MIILLRGLHVPACSKESPEKSPSVEPPIKEKTGSVKLYLLFVEAVGCGTPGPGCKVPVGIPVWPCLALCECPASLFVLRDACAHHPPTIEWLWKGPGPVRLQEVWEQESADQHVGKEAAYHPLSVPASLLLPSGRVARFLMIIFKSVRPLLICKSLCLICIPDPGGPNSAYGKWNTV